MALGHTAGLAQIDRPWGFMLGFLVGVCAGAGVALSVAGFLKRKEEKRGAVGITVALERIAVYR